MKQVHVPKLMQVSFVGDGEGIPPDWLGQDVLALDLQRSLALVFPRNNKERWCAQFGWATSVLKPAECPREFGKCAQIEWDEEAEVFAVTALREPFGATVSEPPSFGFGARAGQHDFWGISEHTPDGMLVRYQLAEPNGDGTFFPMPIVEQRFADILSDDGMVLESALSQATGYLKEITANIDVGELGLLGFAHL
jgi:hypothetical protein